MNMKVTTLAMAVCGFLASQAKDLGTKARKAAPALALACLALLLATSGAHAVAVTDPDLTAPMYDSTVYTGLLGQTKLYVDGLVKNLGIAFIVISLTMTAIGVARAWSKRAFH